MSERKPHRKTTAGVPRASRRYAISAPSGRARLGASEAVADVVSGAGISRYRGNVFSDDSIAPLSKEAGPAKTRPPAVLQVVPSLVTGGVEQGTVDLAGALVAAGWTAYIASAGGPMEKELARVGARHITLPLASKNPLVIRRNAKALADLIRRGRIDIVHARSRAPAWSALSAARATGRRFVTTFHNAYDADLPFKH